MQSHNTTSTTPIHRSGFTLVEIMIVVVIIGLLAALAIPAFQKVRIESYASRLANDYRIFAGSFEVFALEVGTWPADGMGNSLPVAAEPYFDGSEWYQTAPNGGYWDWEVNRLGFVASVGLSEGDAIDPEVFVRVDEKLDDGDLSLGNFRKAGDRYVYILQE